jgi:hypothetical protein
VLCASAAGFAGVVSLKVWSYASFTKRETADLAVGAFANHSLKLTTLSIMSI